MMGMDATAFYIQLKLLGHVAQLVHPLREKHGKSLILNDNLFHYVPC